MNMKLKVSKPILVLGVLIIISLSLAGSGFYLFQKEQMKSSKLQVQLEEVKAKQRIAESKYEQSRKAVDELQAKLDDAGSQVQSLNTQLQEQKSAQEEKINQLTQELEAQKKLRADLEVVLKQGDEELNKTKANLNRIQAEKEALEERMKELGMPFPGVELGRIVVSPESAEVTVEGAPAAAQPAAEVPAGAGKEGKVLVVNRDYNFAVINLGSKDGLNIGDVFSVFHQDNYIGDVKVEKLHDSMAAAGFVSAETKDKVSEGDKVIQKNR